MKLNIFGGCGDISTDTVAFTSFAVLITCYPELIPQLLFPIAHLMFLQHFHTNSLTCPLIIFSFSCTIFSDIVCFLISECCVLTSFYQKLQTLSFNLCNLLYIIPPMSATVQYSLQKTPYSTSIFMFFLFVFRNLCCLPHTHRTPPVVFVLI